MTPFVLMKYEGDYDEVIKAIAERIATLRNGFAHSKLDLEIEAINIADIKIIEELTYAIRLKDMGMSEKDISKAISNLFAENITL